MSDLIQIGIEVKSNADQASKGLDRLQGSVVNNLKVVERLEKNYALLDRALNSNKITAQEYARGVQQVDAAIEQVLNGTLQATKATNQYANATRAATGAMNQYGKVTALGGKNLNRTNMMVQQAGYQFQDFAVQIQGGTNAFVALGQQGSQLLGIFGAGGAVLGAFLAVGTAIARMKTNGKELSVDFKGLGQDLAEILSPLKPIFDGISAALSAVGDALTSLSKLAVTNLDRIATYALTAATVFAGAYVKGVIAARIATMSLVGGLVALRTALIRTGIGALVVLAGELVFQFLRVMKAVGGFGNAITALWNVSKEVLGYIADSFQGIQYSARASFQGMLVSGMESLRGLAEGFGQGLNVISNLVLGNVSGIKSAFSVLPSFIGDIARSAANLFIDGMEALANAGISAVNKVISGFNDLANFLGADKVSEYFGIDLSVNTITEADLSGLKSDVSGAGVSLSEAFKEGFTSAFGQADLATPVLNSMDKIIQEAKSSQEALQGLADQYSGSFADATPELQALIQAIKDGESSVQDLSKHFSLVEKESKKAGKAGKKALTDAEKAAEAYAKALDDQVIGAIGGVADAWGDFVVRGFSDFKGFVSSVLNSFKSMLSNMIAMAAKNKIMLSLGIGGVGSGSVASAAGSIGGTAGNSILSGGGMLSGTAVGAGISAIGTGLSSGFMSSVYGGLGGMSGAISGGLSVGGLGGVATAIGAIAAPLLAVAAVFSFFKKKTKELDSGLQGTITTLDATIESFKVIQTKRFWGLSKKVSTETEALDAEAAEPLLEAIRGIQQGVMDAAGAFGIASDVFDNFFYDFNVSLKGLTEEQQIEKVNEELEKMGDSFASLTGHFETMNELLEAANQRMQLQNRLDQLLGNNQAILTRQREAELAAMHELNRPLAQAIYGLEDAQAAVANAFAGLRASIDKVISDLQSKLSVANEAVNRSRGIFNQLESALSGRYVSGDVASSFSRREGAMSFLRGGDFSDENKLKEALDVVSEPTEDLFGSFVDYARDFARTSFTLEEAKKVAEIQLTADEQQVLLLEQQITDAEAQYQTQIDQYNALLGIDTSVKGVTEAIGTLRGAIEALAAAQAAAKAAAAAEVGSAGVGSAGGLSQFDTGSQYKGFDLLDVGGASGLLKAAGLAGVQTSGKTGLEIAQDIANTTGKAVQLDSASRVQQFAQGGYHTGGMRMVGERGPELEATGPSRIFSHNQTKGMFKDPELVAEVRSLRSEVSGLRSEQRQMQASNVKYVKRNYDINRKWDTDGLPATRT